MMRNDLIHRLNFSFENWPTEIAVHVGGIDYTYRQLDDESDRIANFLVNKFPEERYIGVWGEKVFSTYAAIIGVIKAGKTYVPLNPNFPVKKNLLVIKESGINFVFCSNNSRPSVESLGLTVLDCRLSEFKISNSQLNLESNSPVYLLFTSGSTGNPKGVGITQRQLLHYLDSVSKKIILNPGNRVSHTFDLTFDLSIHDLFFTFIHGATLCVPYENELISPLSYIKSKRITHWFSVPSVLKIMHKLRQLKKDNLSELKYAMFCGEALPSFQVSALKAVMPADSKVFNLYGPTEATISISCYEVIDNFKEISGNVCIGQVFSGNNYKIIDLEGKESDKGELLLEGQQVITSYFNAKTGLESFWKDDQGVSWYRTGDLVEKDKDGDLFFCGRVDTQVKLNGFRVELLEIEMLLLGILSVQNVICFVESENFKLVAVIESDQRFEPGKIISQLSEVLPTYMVPKIFLYLDKFPMNSNHKIDRMAIKEWYSRNGKN